jgi:adenylate cyclase
MRVLTVTTRIGAVVSVFFGIQQFVIAQDALWLGYLSLGSAIVFLLIPQLYRFGDLLPPVVFLVVAYTGMTVSSTYVGSVVIALELRVPHNTDTQPDWAFTLVFIVNTMAAWVLVVATVWYAMREIARAERAMETEYQRSESLLANILPASIAERLKNPAHNIIADKYDDASILFADIVGYTKRASDTTLTELVRFLDALYTDLDALADRHGLEKVKTSGDSYMVVSGVPLARPDHLRAMASLALDMADAVADLKDPQGREVPLRMGLAAGPVVAGVVGARKFFYDVWGDAVNVASRVESTDVEGKGVMDTWYLTGRRATPSTLRPCGSPT